ncbi:MAG: methyltransferase domain-containing protein, partial [Chloroflexi bacterium]|nr:methyltransferase domain-containing protein [Chloroflexota bacterium]
EVGQVRQALQQRNPSGHILEIACGTGLWTEQLLPFAERLTAVDASTDMIALNRQRLASDTIQWVPKAGYRAPTPSFVFLTIHNTIKSQSSLPTGGSIATQPSITI